MEKFTKFTSTAVPLPLNDVDTDLIIPAQFMTSVSRAGYGENLFRRVRETDPGFPTNQERFKDAKILVAGLNFACGSSREHAVWAIYESGIRVVIAKSFADIFYNNSAKNGLMLVVLPEDVVDRILADADAGGYQLSVDLSEQVVVLPDGSKHSFDYDSFRKHCMLNGLDDIDYINASKDEIEAFREKQDAYRFFSTHPVATS